MIVREGNIFEVDTGLIAHGCNCKGAMNSGIAKEIRSRYPIAWEKYREAWEEYTGKYKTDPPPGIIQIVPVHEFLFVVNCLTQADYGRDKKTRYVSYDALDSCFALLADHSESTKQVANFPLIGGGLGNGNRRIIMEIMMTWFPYDNGVLWLPQGDPDVDALKAIARS